ncbi:hypothetical protein NDU88_003945 [Pleurodeles waltl]|uniref:Fibrous sheath-interacting protein 2 n=1 Tax=Pleurodeles waltl TaxID=8319 RepID=A0AAV7VEQ5_PLEWA|nr:hypothetical protein NDU88_003945 [Pleurodeles waltl]
MFTSKSWLLKWGEHDSAQAVSGGEIETIVAPSGWPRVTTHTPVCTVRSRGVGQEGYEDSGPALVWIGPRGGRAPCARSAMDLYLSNAISRDQHERGDGYFRPLIKAPAPTQILNMPLGAKLPVFPGCDVLLYSTELGEKLHTPATGFNLGDPNNYLLETSYNNLHDPHLSAYYKRKKMLQKLKRDGFITDDNKVICSLKEFNDYRQYLTTMKLDFERSYLREQKYLEKQVANLDGPEADAHCLHLQRSTKKTFRGRRGPRKHKFLEMLTEELEKAAEEKEGHGWTQDGIRAGEHHRRKLLLRSKMEEDWKLQEMLLLMRIGQDVRREAKLEAQQKKCRDERAKKKQRLLQKRMSYHFDKMQKLVRRRGTCEKPSQHDVSPPQIPKRISPLRQTKTVSTVKTPFPKPTQNIRRPPVIQSVAKRTPITSALPIKKESPIQVKRETSPLIPVVPKPSPSKPSPLQEKVEEKGEEPQKTSLSLQTQGVQTSDSLLADAKAEKQSTIVKEPQTEDIKDDLQKTDDVKPEEDVCRPSLQKPEAPVCKEDYDSALTLPYDTICDEEQSSFISKLQEMQGEASVDDLRSIFQNIVTWVVTTVIGILYPAVTMYEDRVRILAHKMPQEQYSISDSSSISDLKSTTEDEIEDIPLLTPPIQTTSFYERIKSEEKIQSLRTQSSLEICEMYKEMSSVRAIEKSSSVPNIPEMITDFPQKSLSCKSDSYISNLTRPSFLGSPFPERLIPRSSGPSSKIKLSSSVLPYNLELETSQISVVQPELEDEIRAYDAVEPVSQSDLGSLKLEERISTCIMSEKPDSVQMGITEPEQHLLKLVRSQLTQLSEEIVENTFKKIITDLSCSFSFVRDSSEVCFATITEIQPEECWTELESRSEATEHSTLEALISNLEVSCIAKDVTEHIFGKLESAVLETYTAATSRKDEHSKDSAHSSVYQEKEASPKTPASLSLAFLCGTAKEIINIVSDKLESFATSKQKRICETQLSDSRKSLIENIIQQLCDTSEEKSSEMAEESAGIALYDHSVELVPTSFREQIRGFIFKMDLSGSQIFAYIGDILKNVLGSMEKELDRNMIHKSSNEQISSNEISFLYELVSTILNQVNVFDCKDHLQAEKSETVENCMRLPHCSLNEQDCLTESKPEPIPVNPKRSVICQRLEIYEDINVPGMVVYSDRESEGECSNLMSSCAERKRSRHKNRHKYDDKSGFQKCDLKSGENLVSDAEELGFLNQDLAKKNKNNNKTVKCPILAAAESVVASIFAKIMLDIDPCVSLTKEKAGWDSTERVEQELIIEKSKANNKLSDIHFFSASDLELFALDITESIIKMLKVVSKLICTSNTEFVFAPSEDVCGPLSTLNDVLDNTHTVSSVELSDVSISSKENNEQNKEISACQTCTTSIVGHQLASKSQTSLMLNDVGEQIIIMILMKLRKFFYLKCESKSEYQLFENTFSSEFPSYADIPPLLQATLEPLPDNLSRQISIQVSKPDSSKSDHSGSKNCMLQLELCNCANKVIKNIMDIIQKELNADSLNQQSVSSETYSDENVSFAHADCSPVESQEKNLLLPEGKSLPETYTDENVSFAHADCSPVESQEKNLSLPEGKSLPETYTDENVSFARVDCSPFESQELKLLLPEGKSLSSENISKNIVVVSSFINNILNLLCSEKYVSEMVSKYSAEWSTTSNLSHIQEKDPNVQDNHTDKLKYAGKITLSKNYLKNGTEFPMQECSPEDCILHFIVNKVEAEVISVVANIVSEMMQKFAHSHTFPSHVVSSVITSSSVQSLEISSEPNIYDPSKLQSEYSVDEASLLNLEIQLMSYDIVEDMLNNLCIFVVDQSKTVTDYRNRTEIHDPCIIEGEIAEPGLTREFPLSMLTSIAEDIFITVLAKFERFVKLKLGSWQEATSEESRQGLAEGDEPQNIVDPLEVKRNQSMHIFTSQELAAYADASGTEMQSNESKLTLKCKLHSYAKDISHTIMNVIQNTVEEETQNCILSMFESANEIDIIKKLCSFIVGQSSAQIKETGKEFVLDSNSVQQLEEFKNDNAYLGVCISDFISSPEREEESKDRQQQFESTLGKPESLTMSPVEVQHSSKQMYTYSDQIAVLKVLKNVKDYIFEHVFNKLQEDCKDIQRSQIVQGVKLILGDMFLKYFMDVILPPFFTHSGELSATSKKMVYETFLKLDGKSACTLDSASADSIPPYDTIKIIFLKFHSVFFSSVSLEEILCSEECNHHPNIKAIIKQSNNLLELADKQDSELKTTDEIDIGSQQTTAVEFQNSHFRKEKIHPSSSATYSNVDHILKEVATRIEALAALNNASLECVDSLNKNSARDSASYSSVEHSPFLEGIQKALMGDNADIGALNKKTVSSQLLPKKLNEYAREVVNTILTGIKKRIEEEMKSKIFSMDFREKNSLARKIIQLVLDCVLNRKEFPPNDYTLQEALGLNMHISVAPHNPLAQNAQTFHFEPSSQERILAHVDTPCSRQQDDEAEGKSQLNTEDSSQSFLPQAKDFPSLTSQIQHKNIFPEMLSEELAFRQALEFQIGNTVENALNDIFQRRMYDGENCHFHTSWHEQETFNNNVSQFSESNNTFSNKAKMCSLISKPDINYVSNAVVGIVLESLCSSSKIDMDANGSNPLKKGIQPKSSAESMIEKVATRLKSFTTLPPDSKFIVELQRKKNVITAESSTSEDNIEEITLRRQVQPAFPELITSFSESPSAAARSRIKRNICGKIRNEDEGQLQFDTHAEIIVCKILEFIKSDMNSRMAHQESRRSIPCEQRLVRDTIENLLQSFPTKEKQASAICRNVLYICNFIGE